MPVPAIPTNAHLTHPNATHVDAVQDKHRGLFRPAGGLDSRRPLESQRSLDHREVLAADEGGECLLGRHYKHGQELYKQFTKRTGIKVNLLKAKDRTELLAAASRPRETTARPMCLVLVDAARLQRAQDDNLFSDSSSEGPANGDVARRVCVIPRGNCSPCPPGSGDHGHPDVVNLIKWSTSYRRFDQIPL